MSTAALLAAAAAGVCPLGGPTTSVVHGVVSQAILTVPGLRVTLFHFAAGQELSEPTTPARALVPMLAGSCDFILNGETRCLTTGELLHLPPKLPHAVRATTDLTLLIMQAAPPKA